MLRRVVLLALLVLAALPGAAAARPPAAVLQDPAISWVRVGDVLPAAGEPAGVRGRVVVRVRVVHRPLEKPAPRVRTVGAITVVLSRYSGGRDYSIGGGTAARALPVIADPLGVVYRVVLNPRQSAAARAAGRAGTLRALVLVDQRATARRRAPVVGNDLSLRSARVASIATRLPADAPPLMSGRRAEVVIDADRAGRPIVRRVSTPLGDGRVLELAVKSRIGGIGEATPLRGTARLVGADGSALGEVPIPDGASLELRSGLRPRALLVLPQIEVPDQGALGARRVVLRTPSSRR